jgi:small-conductance mechanosensitive channel
MIDQEILQYSILNNPLEQWLLSVITAVFCYATLRLLKRVIRTRLARIASMTETRWDDIVVDAVNRTRSVFLLLISIFFGSLFLQLPARFQTVFLAVVVIALLIQLGIWLNTIILSVIEQYRARSMAKNPAAATTINVIGFISKIAIWSALALVALDTLGINVTTLVAGLGIGGVAVALAVQNILGDVFASLSIILDKPFVIGDFLVIDDFLGSVEYVGLKTTRVRSLSGEQLIFSNSDLLNSRIRNYGRMFERRVVFSIGVTYDTPREKLKQIPAMIRDAVNAEENTRFDRSHFMKYGDYALQYETVYYVLSPDYNAYMDIQQSIYFAIHEAFEKAGISFAYPTQKLFVAQTSG